MTQKELNRSVAQATGESIRTIANFGFILLDASPESLDDEHTCLQCGIMAIESEAMHDPC
jgi:hypothetical protein